MNGCILSWLSWKVPQVNIFSVGGKLTLCLPLDCFASRTEFSSWGCQSILLPFTCMEFTLLSLQKYSWCCNYFFFSCSLKRSVEQSSECKGLNRLWGKRYCKFLEKHLQIYKMLCVTMTLFPLPTYICCVMYYLANELLGGLELGCL